MSAWQTARSFFVASLRKAPPGPRIVERSLGYRCWVVHFFAANAGALALVFAHHPLVAALVFFTPAPWYSWNILKPSSRGLGPVVTRFATQQREVWLTVDDGPDPSSTPPLLELLDQQGAKATFFLIGEKAHQHPELVSAILRRGHAVANHTFSHPHNTFWCASRRRTASEIDRGNTALQTAGAPLPRLFRPPVGVKNHALHPELSKRDMQLVLWSARGYDAVAKDADRTVQRILKDVKPGAIILVHETPSRPAQQTKVIGAVLAHLASNGYRCVIPAAESLNS